MKITEDTKTMTKKEMDAENDKTPRTLTGTNSQMAL